MPKNAPTKENNRPTPPAWLDTARGFYADTFGTRRARDLRKAREDWADLTEDEQTFAQAHLLYLDLMAQAANQNLLLQIRDLLEEVADSLVVLRESGPAEDEEPEDEEPIDDDEAREVVVPQGGMRPPIPFQHPVVGPPTVIDVPASATGDNDDWRADPDDDEEEDADDDGSGGAA